MAFSYIWICKCSNVERNFIYILLIVTPEHRHASWKIGHSPCIPFALPSDRLHMTVTSTTAGDTEHKTSDTPKIIPPNSLVGFYSDLRFAALRFRGFALLRLARWQHCAFVVLCICASVLAPNRLAYKLRLLRLMACPKSLAMNAPHTTHIYSFITTKGSVISTLRTDLPCMALPISSMMTGWRRQKGKDFNWRPKYNTSIWLLTYVACTLDASL